MNITKNPTKFNSSPLMTLIGKEPNIDKRTLLVWASFPSLSIFDARDIAAGRKSIPQRYEVQPTCQPII